MKKTPIEPISDAYRVLNPGSVVVISVGDGDKDNLFAVTWNMPVRKNPPMAAILSGKRHHSYGFMARTGEFAINVLPAEQVDALYACGTLKGRLEPDKFTRAGLTRLEARTIGAPLVAEAVASLECRVCQVVDLGQSSLLVAQIVDACADPRHFVDGHWTFENGLRLLHHLSGQEFCVSPERVTANRAGG